MTLFCGSGGSVATTPTPLDFTNANMVGDGNSLMAGQNGTPFTVLLNATAPFDTNGAVFYNYGVGGQTTAMMSADAASQIDVIIDSGVLNVLFVWEIGNDIYFNGDAAAAEARFQTYCEARRTAGWDKIIVLTCTPRNQTSSFGDNAAAFNAKLSAANTWLRANYTTFSDGLADPALDSRLMDYNNSTYFSDGTHLTTPGYQVVADLVYDVLMSLS